MEAKVEVFANDPKAMQKAQDIIARADISNALKECVEFNKQQIIAWMRDHSVKKITVEYQGYGDSGGVEFIRYDGHDPGRLAEQMIAYLRKVYRPGTCALEVAEGSVNNFLEEFTEMLLELFEHDGYANNEGGQGQVVFRAPTKKFPEGAISLHHEDNVVECVESEHEL